MYENLWGREVESQISFNDVIDSGAFWESQAVLFQAFDCFSPADLIDEW